MKIVIDARIIDGSTGVYVQRLLHFIQLAKTNDTYVVLVPPKTIKKWKKVFKDLTFVVADQPPYTFAEQLSLARQIRNLKPDLVHFTMPQQPLLWRGKSVTTVHDTTLIRFDNVDMNPIVYRVRKEIFKMLVRTVIRRSKKIFVPTEFVKKDLADFMKQTYKDKVMVTLEAGDSVDAEPEIIEVLQSKQFLFFVGNAFPYKNIKLTIQAYAELKKTNPDLHLALAGKPDYFYEQLESYVAEKNIPDVHFLGFISDGEKRWAYQNAVAFVTSSLSEGFHIPLLEAMYEGCPVVSSNASCLPEVAGDAALYFDPRFVQDLVDMIEKVLGEDGIREKLIEKGYTRVKLFSWKRMTDQTLSAYKEVLEKR